VRAGSFIILVPDKNYYELFLDNRENIFVHHLLLPYYYLAQKLPGNGESVSDYQ